MQAAVDAVREDHSIHSILVEHFHENCVSAHPILLLLDGHTSHYQPDLITYAKDYQVVLFCLPPHTTHKSHPTREDTTYQIKNTWISYTNSILTASWMGSGTSSDHLSVTGSSSDHWWASVVIMHSLMDVLSGVSIATPVAIVSGSNDASSNVEHHSEVLSALQQRESRPNVKGGERNTSNPHVSKLKLKMVS